MIGSYSAVAPNKRQTIICTSDGLFYWLGLNEYRLLESVFPEYVPESWKPFPH